MAVHWHQRDVEATAIAPGSLTPPDAVVRAAISRARERGLEVMVFPIVWVEQRGPGKWRGTLEPRDVDRWWSAYERFIVHYATLAERGGAEWMSVGSELGSTEAWRQRWFHLIGRVRRRYSGALIYSANWDHHARVSFWQRLDAVGINGYFSLAKKPGASVDAMAARWVKVGRRLLGRAAAAGKPLVLTEVGYLSRAGSAVDPWNYTRGAPVDGAAQRRAYAAFAAAWERTGQLGGVFFWNYNGDGGPRDRDYTPRGKPAAKVVRRFFGAPARARWSRSAE